MFRRGANHFRRRKILIVKLDPFALSNCVPSQANIALADEGDQDLLPRRMRLGALFMSQWKQDGRERPRSSSRNIQIGRYVEAWLTFEDDLFDAIPIGLDSPGHARIERRAFRKAAQR